MTTPSRVLNPAYRKINITRIEINNFKSSLLECLEHIKISDDKNESEENIKKYIGDFLHKSFYQNYLINTKDRIDLAIYAGKDATSNISVLIEAKRPSNTGEFLKTDNINKKALQELLLYYLRERIEGNNNQIKHLIATNGYEWYFFKGEDFYNFFYKNKNLLKEYNEFIKGQKDSTKNELFYNEIAKKYIEEVKEELPFLYINIKSDYEQLLPLSNTNDDKLVSLYKVFSPIHLLAQSYGNDSNELNAAFYFELLHIIGLEEVKENSKKLIKRKVKETRNDGSLLETTIFILEDRNYINKVKNLSNYGKDREEQLFNVALELCLTWINRILFLKLLEAQLVVYNNDESYKFLNTDFITRFNDLEDLFFSAVAKKMEDRNKERIQEKYKRIPYLNSSLFEPNELEDAAIQISNINGVELEIYDKTVLKDNLQRLTGKIPLLSYIFRFLDAFDFSGEDQNKVDESNQAKTLISSSVLGLIFEKINGYKEGSFYTPAYITMYMAKEVLHRTVVQKFNAHYDWKCGNFEELKEGFKDYIQKGDRKTIRREATKIINSIKICDPAVGSGHFLVSALNELMVIKSELSLLVDKDEKRLNIYIQVVDDELVIENEDSEVFVYRPKSSRSKVIQEALFHEKQNLIESCLFGVDINPNSVKICRLRLWIELLKNAYYINYKKNNELQTLPNIDINIKTGNSLISRFDLYEDLQNAFKSKNNPYSIEDYKNAVKEYKNTNDKERKAEIIKIIDTIKMAFTATIDSKFKKKISFVRGYLERKQTEIRNLEVFKQKVSKTLKTELKKLELELQKIQEEKETLLSNVIYQKAFEWRFEFPEVLDSTGEFIGFDIVIGNPPYIRQEEFSDSKYYLENNYQIYNSVSDLLTYFVELGYKILKDKGNFQFIISNKFARANYGETMRSFLLKNTSLTDFIDFSGIAVFDEATVDTAIIGFKKEKATEKTQFEYLNVEKGAFSIKKSQLLFTEKTKSYNQSDLTEKTWTFENPQLLVIKNKIEEKGIPLKEWNISISRGILTGYNEAFIIDENKKNELIAADLKSAEILKPILRGRDIQKYVADFQNLWVIATFPNLKLNIDDYPAVKKHLESFGKRIAQTGEEGSRKKTTNKWFEIQDSIAYWKNFEKTKIIYPNMTKYLPFILDKSDGYYHNDKSFHIITDRIYWLVSFLNSKLFKYCFRDNFPELLGGTREIRKVFFDKIPVKQVSKEEEKPFIILVNKILKAKKANSNNKEADTSALEHEIDILVYKLYDLTYEEILLTDSDFELSEEEYKK
jgi:type II restriction/modification system DNA methylase subunit YeeA